MSQDKISIASAACILLGADPVQSFDEDTTEALAARTFYDMTYEAAIKDRNWSFAKARVKLARLQKESEYGYKYVYRLNVVALKLVTVNEASANYKLVKGRELHTDEDMAEADIIVKPEEAELPGDFVLALTFLMASVFAPTVTDDSSQAERYEKKGAVLMAKAGNADAVQGNLRYRAESQLLSAHNGSGVFYGKV